jgi:hypothetical protein
MLITGYERESLRLANPTIPIIPVPNRAKVEGSGVIVRISSPIAELESNEVM